MKKKVIAVMVGFTASWVLCSLPMMALECHIWGVQVTDIWFFQMNNWEETRFSLFWGALFAGFIWVIILVSWDQFQLHRKK